MLRFSLLVALLLNAACVVSSAPCSAVYVKFQYAIGDTTWNLNSTGSAWEDATSTVVLAQNNGETTVTFRAAGSGTMIWSRVPGPCNTGGGFVLKSNTSTAPVPTISIVESK